MELTKENFIFLAAICTAIGTLIGAVVGAIVTFSTVWLNQRAEERRQYRALLLNTAVEYWKFETEKLNSTKSLEEYILRVDSFYHLFVEDNPDMKKVKKKMENVNSFLHPPNQ